MRKSKSLNVREYIEHIESAGWEYIGYSFPYYRFKGINGKRAANGNNLVEFTLFEIREAFKNGW